MKGKETWILVADEAIAPVLRRVARDDGDLVQADPDEIARHLFPAEV